MESGVSRTKHADVSRVRTKMHNTMLPAAAAFFLRKSDTAKCLIVCCVSKFSRTMCRVNLPCIEWERSSQKHTTHAVTIAAQTASSGSGVQRDSSGSSTFSMNRTHIQARTAIMCCYALIFIYIFSCFFFTVFVEPNIHTIPLRLPLSMCDSYELESGARVVYPFCMYMHATQTVYALLWWFFYCFFPLFFAYLKKLTSCFFLSIYSH